MIATLLGLYLIGAGATFALAFDGSIVIPTIAGLLWPVLVVAMLVEASDG